MKIKFIAMVLMLVAGIAQAEVERYPLPNNSTFPIAEAVEVKPGTTLVYLSGKVPAPANREAERGSAEFWGDTKVQTISVLERIKSSLEAKGLTMGDVIKMTVFLVGDPSKGGKMDFRGFMEAYTQYFGTEEQPNLPSRSAVQIAGLVSSGMLVEIEVVAARPE